MEIEKRIVCYDAFKAGFTITPFSVNQHPATDLLPSEATDLLLTHPDADYQNLIEHSLFVVNSLIYPASKCAQGIALYRAAQSAQKDNRVAVIAFDQIASLQAFVLDESILERPEQRGDSLREALYLRSPVTLDGVTPLLIMAGFWQPFSLSLSRIGERLLRLSTSALQLEDRLRLSWGAYPYPLSDDYYDGRSLNREIFLSNDVLYPFLLSGNSQLVLIHTSDWTLTTGPVNSLGLPGRYQLTRPAGDLMLFEDGGIAHAHYDGNAKAPVIATQRRMSTINRYRSTDYRQHRFLTSDRECSKKPVPSRLKFVEAKKKGEEGPSP